jgi:carboxylate-amine ligase
VTEDGGTAGTDLTLGVEEELHVVDLTTRELVPRAPEVLDRLDAASYSAELHRSVVETNTPVTASLDGLRDGIVALRRRAIEVAESLGLGLIAAGTVPLVDLESLPVTPTSRYRRMLDDYQMLVREQLICGAQVHVGIPDRDEAVSVAQRVAPVLPVLLALSASSPYWLGHRRAAGHRRLPRRGHRGAAGRPVPRVRVAGAAGVPGRGAGADHPAAAAPGGDVAGGPLRARG